MAKYHMKAMFNPIYYEMFSFKDASSLVVIRFQNESRQVDFSSCFDVSGILECVMYQFFDLFRGRRL